MFIFDYYTTDLHKTNIRVQMYAFTEFLIRKCHVKYICTTLIQLQSGVLLQQRHLAYKLTKLAATGGENSKAHSRYVLSGGADYGS